MESLAKDSRNLDPESIIRFASTDLGDGPRASNDQRASEHVSSSTGAYDSTLSNSGIHDSNDHSRYWSGKRGETIARLLEISAHPPSFSSNRPRSYDVYIGFHGCKPLLLRFTNWIRGELGAHGLSCFVTDRARCRNSRKHGVARKAMDGSSFGVVILTRHSFKNPYTIEELNFFSGKRNLVPLYFDLSPQDCLARDIIEKRGELWEKHGGKQWLHYGGIEKEWRDAIDALSSPDDDWKLDANDGKWRDCILRAVALLASRLGRRSVVDRLTKWREKVEREEFPFPRNENFVGRKKELSELEFMLFGDVRGEGERNYFDIKARWRRKNSKGEGGTAQSDGKEPVLWRESEKEIEMQNPGISQTPEFKSIPRYGRRKRSAKIVYGKGIACVSGDPGIGKTELLLEFAYRYHQRYKMVLWIGGESRYIRQNYLNLWSFLEIDVGIEGYAENGRTRSFEEREEAAVARVRKELMRNIPFLVVIDNLENEKDWWDHKLVMDLLPRFGGETHVIISTRLSCVMNIEPLKLSFLSGVEAMALMQGEIKDQPTTEFDVLRVIEERLGRLTLGLAIVGSILAELPINPSRLLDTVIRMPSSEITWSSRENNWLRRKTFLLQLFEVCFSIFDHADGRDSLASRMALASGWLGPGPIPVPILSLAARKMPEKSPRARIWRKVVRSLTCGFTSSYARRSETEAVSLLVRFNMARGCTKDGLVQPNGLLRLYARARGGPRAARPTVQAVMARGSIHHHADHMWAACFLVLGFGKDPAVVELRAAELLFLVKEVMVPLAVRAFVTFSRCGPAVEVLRLCTEALEVADQVFVAGSAEKWLDGSLCWRPVRTAAEMDPGLWQELALGRAGVLEVRAKLMARGNQFDIGDDLIRKAIFIRTSICGEDHPDTVAARETLGKITRMASGVQSHHS